MGILLLIENTESKITEICLLYSSIIWSRSICIKYHSAQLFAITIDLYFVSNPLTTLHLHKSPKRTFALCYLIALSSKTPGNSFSDVLVLCSSNTHWSFLAILASWASLSTPNHFSDFLNSCWLYRLVSLNQFHR